MNEIKIFQNEQFGQIIIVVNENNEPLFIYEDLNGECTFNIYDLLAIAYKSDDEEYSYKLISLLDCFSFNNNTYWALRDAVMTARVSWRIQKSYAYENSKCKTYLMKDENTGFTKIGKSIHPSKRERTLQSEKPTISLFKVCDKLVERELHNYYSNKNIRGEWYNLSNEDIEYIISQYNFK